MYNILVHIHSYLRYAVLLLLVIVIIKSLAGWLGKQKFVKSDEKFALFLMIAAHTQLLLGLVLYYVSPLVQFSSGTMKDKLLRYWAVEHSLMMIIAIVLITIAKSSLKRLTTDESKHKRLFIFNTLALLVIVTAILMSGRGLI